MKNSIHKKALITGSTSGIGYQLARKMAQKGYDIVFHGLEADGQKIADSIATEFKIRTLYSNANLADPDQVKALSQMVQKEWGGIDTLVNNAGMQYVSEFENFSLEKFRQLFEVNFFSAVALTQAFWETMKKNNHGRVVNIASVHGIRASEFKTAYVASKHALIGLTKTLALEGAPHHITVNAICPGYVKTPIVEKQIEDQARVHQMSAKDVVEKVLLKKQAVKEFVSIESIVDTAMLLLEPHANALSGACWVLDGAWSVQ